MEKVSKYVCECKGVSKHEIVHAIRKYNAYSIQDIQIVTKASTGCGRCKPLIVNILGIENQKRNLESQQLKINFNL